jgi:hypothetical protein
MAHPRLSAAAALALLVGACDDGRADLPSQSSITVKLPPARPHEPAPSFSFDAPGKAEVKTGEVGVE